MNICSETTFVAMRCEHVPAVTAIHLRSFPSFFLTFLGPRFLRLLYSEILNQPDHAAFVAMNSGGQIIGFIAGIGNQVNFYGRLAWRRWFAFGVASLSAILRRPMILRRLIRALWQSRNAQRAAAPACLMSLAVAPESECHGVGQALVHRFLKEMRGKGVSKVSLTTDKDNNDRVNKFYCQLGFRLTRNFITPEGRSMNEYVIVLGDVNP